MSTLDQPNLLKLSREQLKQLCKERGHTGYSKCTKPQMVALLGSNTPSKFNSSMMTIALPSKQDTSSSAPVSKKRPESGSGIGESVAKKQRRPNPTPPGSGFFVQPSVTSAPSETRQNPRLAQGLPILRDLFVSPVSTTPAAVLPVQNLTLPSTSRLLPPPLMGHSLSLLQPSSRLHTTLNSQSRTHEAEKQENGTSLPTTYSSQPPSGGNTRTQLFKKFLDPRNGVTSKHLVHSGPHDAHRSAILPSSSTEPLPTPYLDFPAPPVPVLGLIGMPPSISDRRKVHSWSIILSGISDADRRVCVLVSRMFRYAGKSALRLLSLGSHLYAWIVYLSASAILFSKFPGKRLDDTAHAYSPLMFNLWPYLRAREAELAEQRRRYLQSFLHRFHGTFEPIHWRLWASPDNPKQCAVAVRYAFPIS
jgi:hypothetical protein